MSLVQYLVVTFYIFILPLAIAYVLSSFKPIAKVVDRLFFSEYDD